MKSKVVCLISSRSRNILNVWLTMICVLQEAKLTTIKTNDCTQSKERKGVGMFNITFHVVTWYFFTFHQSVLFKSFCMLPELVKWYLSNFTMFWFYIFRKNLSGNDEVLFRVYVKDRDIKRALPAKRASGSKLWR